MKNEILGIHHITAMASDPQKNIDFYVNVLGLRFVKKSINQDAPDVYHLYYGDAIGSPGTAMTFFPFGRAARGMRGTGEISRVAFSVPIGSQDFWMTHLAKNGITFNGPERQFDDETIHFLDPDGMTVELVFTDRQELKNPWRKSSVPVEFAVQRLFGVTMNLADAVPTSQVLTDLLGARFLRQKGNRSRYMIGTGADSAAIDLEVDPAMPKARQSAGSVHHIAWRVADDDAHQEWHRKVNQNGLMSSDIIDRFYFHSIYFREPGGILYEIATDNPGFTVDESPEELGTRLVLPPWFEPHREKIERALPPVSVSLAVRNV